MFQSNNLSIRFKIIFISLIGGFGLILNILYTHVVVKNNSFRLNEITNIYFPIIQNADACITHLDKIKKAFSESISAGELIFIKEARASQNAIYRYLDNISTTSPDNSNTVYKLRNEFDTYYTSNKELAEGIISGKLNSIYLKNAVTKNKVSMEIFEQSLLHFRNTNSKIFLSLISSTDAEAKKSLDVGIIIFIIVGLSLIFSTLTVIKTLNRSFSDIIGSLKNMALGEVKNYSIKKSRGTDGTPIELIRVKEALDSVTSRFIETENEVLHLNASLQEKVDDATSQLQSVNKKLNEAVISANEASQAKSAFLANMSHELRTPMNAIIGYGELIEEDINNKEYENMTDDIRSVRTASNHLLSLISDILDLSKIEAGKMEFKPVPFNLVQLTDDIEATVKPLAMNGNNTYTVDIQTKSMEMFTDLTKLKQILLNLLSNACKFTSNGEIKLIIKSYYETHAEYLHFEVCDTGIGIPAKNIATLFDSFTQVDSTTTKKFGGTGLGLAISRRYAQSMGGDIQAESSENNGSKFVVIMPLRLAKDMASGM